MLLMPGKRATADISAHFLRINNHQIRKAITMINKKGKPRPRSAMNHQRSGLIYGAKQANMKRRAIATLQRIKNRLVRRRNLVAIDAIYEIESSKPQFRPDNPVY